MILFNKLVNHICTDQTAQAGLCLCSLQMLKTGFHAQGPLNVKIIKEDNSSVFTADEQLGGAKKKIFNWFWQFIHICSQVTSDSDVFTLTIDCWLPFNCQGWRPNRCEFPTQYFVGLDYLKR